MENVTNTIYYSTAILNLLPVVIALPFLKKLDTKVKLLVLYFALSFLMEVSNMVLVKMKLSTMPIFFIDIVVVTLIFSRIFYLAVDIPSIKKTILTISVLFIIISLADAFINGVKEYTVISSACSSILLIVYPVLFFYVTFIEARIIDLEKHSMFWINCSALLYFSLTFFLYLSMSSMSINYWILQQFFNVVFILLSAVAVIVEIKFPSKSPTSKAFA
jgi:hypothetical protein